MNVRATYSVAKWEETVYDQISDEAKLTKASVVYECSGDLSGTAAVEYLMFYSRFDPRDPHMAEAAYVGLIRFRGKIKDKAGSFVLQDRGTFHEGLASSSLAISPGSGTGALRGITGTGTYTADKTSCRIELDCVLPP